MRVFWLPLLLAVIGLPVSAPAQQVDECLSTGAPIDSNLPPVVETIVVTTDLTVVDVQVPIDITHTFQGDLDIFIENPGGVVVQLHDTAGGADDDIFLTWTDQGVPNGSQPYTCGCAMQPAGMLSDFVLGPSLGNWTLTVDDTLGGDIGNLNSWCIVLSDTGPPPPIQGLSCSSEPGTGIADISWSNPVPYDEINVYVEGILEATLPGDAVTYSTVPQTPPVILTIEVEAVESGNASVAIACNVTLQPDGAGFGPDVIYSDCQSISNFGVIGGTRAYALGSFTCNIGTENLAWGSITPLLAMNAYRLNEGRLEQIGMSWVKNGTGAAAGSGCGLPCNGQGGSVLGVGCLDVYGSGFNGSQGILGPRSNVNAYTGDYPGASGPGGTLLDKRLQIDEVDLAVSGALYFVEGVYVAWDDAGSGNALNNASYKRITVNTGSFDLTPVGSMEVTIPAIRAWRDHGLGIGLPDPSVEVTTADVPSEGRFHLASKVTDLGGGTWRYDYAVFNLNSHRSAGSFSVPVPAGANVTNVGFHDVDYHTGEPFDPTDWSPTVGPDSVTWSSPETFAQNPNSNALRFGTMYNFWFDCDVEPEFIDATLGLFRPGTPDSIQVTVEGPAGAPPGVDFLRGDADGDGTFNGIVDGISILDFQFTGGEAPPCLESADADGNAVFNGLVDGTFVLAHQFSSGPPPPAPYPSCGPDPDIGTSLGCDSHPGCP